MERAVRGAVALLLVSRRTVFSFVTPVTSAALAHRGDAVFAGRGAAAAALPVLVVRQEASRSLATLVRAGKETLEMPNDKLVYDERTGRFFEKEIEEVCRDEYCAIDENTGRQVLLTREEKERIFIDSIQSFYYSGRKLLADADFDKLKEDLVWEGSEVVLLNRNEALFLSAMSAYLKGAPIISDEEFDNLKKELREAGSKVAVSTEPKCYIDTGICSVTFEEDKLRQSSLYVFPSGIIFGLFWLGALYELIEPLRHVNPIFVLALAALPTWASATVFTENVFLADDPLVAVGACPSCGFKNRVFFGSILGVKGATDEAKVKCQNCKEEIMIRRRDLRARTQPKV